MDWINEYGAHAVGFVYLDMPEMSVHGLVEVLTIEPCPPLATGPGRLITGTFEHRSGEIYDLKLESESEPIGVTDQHPFWSVDRKTWVSVIDLRIGETLQTLTGTTVVECRSKREESETVYNIEVEGDHVYRVGKTGVLVHNASAIPIGNGPCERRLAKMTCTNARIDELEAEKDQLQAAVPGQSCSKSKVSKKKLAKYPCSEIRARLAALRLLSAKREQIQTECFGGTPDATHAQAIQEVQNAITACEALEAVNCAPGHPMANM